MRTTIVILVLVLLTLVTMGCGGGSQALPEAAQAPVIEILFPRSETTSSSGTLTVTGTARDEDGVESVTVNGVVAESNDGFVTWRAEIDLALGENTITVVSADELGNVDEAAAVSQVEYLGPFYSAVSDMVLSPDGDSAYVFNFGTVLEIDLETGNRVVVGGDLISGAPAGSFALSAADQRLFTYDVGNANFLAIDLVTGDRNTIPTTGVGAGPALTAVGAFTYDSVGGRLIALAVIGPFTSPLNVAVIAVDPITGARTILSSNDDATAGPIMTLSDGVVLDQASNELLVRISHVSLWLVAVNLSTGQRRLVVNNTMGSGPSTGSEHVFDIDAVNNLAFTAGNGSVYEVNLLSGDRTLLSAGSAQIRSLKVDPNTGRIRIASSDAILDVDRASGERVQLCGTRRGVGVGLDSISTMALDLETDEVFIARNQLSRFSSIARSSGDRALLSGSTVESFYFRFTAFDLLSRRVFAYGSEPLPSPQGAGGSGAGGPTGMPLPSPSLYAIDLETGSLSLFSTALADDGPMGAPTGAVYDAQADRLLMTFPAMGIHAFDLESGTLSEVSGPTLGSGPLPANATHLTHDRNNDRLFVLDQSAELRLIQVDLITGNRSLVTVVNAGGEPWSTSATAFAVNRESNRGYMFVHTFDGSVNGPPDLIEVDLDSGLTRVLATLPKGFSPGGSSAIVIDPVRNTALSAQGGLFEVELESGDFVLISR